MVTHNSKNFFIAPPEDCPGENTIIDWLWFNQATFCNRAG
jgi:hypothetical protein